jgi:hypothetical protein
MRSPHRNDPDFFASPAPHQREVQALNGGRRLPSLLVRARCRLMARRPAIEETIRVDEVERAFGDYLRPLAFVPFELHAAG